jgi:polysaccharide export outer membrane protein
MLNRPVRIALAAILLPFVLAVSTAWSDVQPGYLLQPGDVLIVSVWKEDELQRQVLIRPDGGINFPLVGEINTRGMTVDTLRDRLTDGLAQFIPEPEVNVSVQATNGNLIYVVGKVNRPGSFVAARPTDVVQALGLAGGLNRFADADEIKVLRREQGQQLAYPFRYGDIEDGEGLEQNILLKPGDIVIVP